MTATTTCPRCGHTVIATHDGTQLNPDRSIVGRYLPDGYELTPNQQRDPTIRGHHLHHCPPGATRPRQPTPPQEALF